MKRLLACFLAIWMTCTLTGCWQDDSGTIEDDGLWPHDQVDEPQAETLLPATFSLPYLAGQTLDPITCPDGMQQVVSSLICEGLFHLDSSFQPQPVLCASYTRNDTARIYDLTLRDDVVFSDGSPLTAADVRASLLRAKTSTRYANRLSNVQSITAKGNTLTITLNQPNSNFISLLDIPIVKSGTEKSTPIGTGPYLYADLDGSSCLVASQNWWQGITQPTNRILLAETSDQSAVLYRFTSRDIQLLMADMTGSTPINATGQFDQWAADTTILQYLGCNAAKAPLDNVPFRNCLSMGINRSHLVNAYLSGHGRAAQFPVSPASPLYPSDLEKPYSAADFSAALENCGYTPNRTLTLLVNSENSFKVSAATYLASTFSAAGIPTEVNALPWEDFLAALAAGRFDLYYGEIKLQADWDLSSLLATGGSLNYCRQADPDLDELLLAYRTAEDSSTAMADLCRHLQSTAPILPICFKSVSVLTQSDVLDGLSPTAAEPFYDLSSCVIHLKES